MKKRNLLCVTLLILLTAVSGCNNKRNSNEDQGGIEIENPSMEDGLDVSEISENSYAYFDNLEGEWVIAEYVGAITDSHSEEMTEETYIEKQDEFTDDLIEEYLGSEFCVEKENVESWEPISELGYMMEDDDLNALETYPSHDSYWNDSLVL